MLYGAEGRVIAPNDLADALAGEPLADLAIAEVHAIFRHARRDGIPLAPADLPPARALAGDEMVAEPLVVTAAGGRTLDVLVTASPIRDGGAIAGAFVTWIDVSCRARPEEGENRMRGLLDRNPCLVFLKDEGGRYVYLNETYENQFVHGKDWYGKTDLDFWPPENAELFRANDREILGSGETQQFLEDTTDRTGARYVWLNYKFPFTDAAGLRYVGGVGIDATAFVQAEEVVQRSQATLSAALGSMTDAVAISDAGGGLVEINEAFASFHRFGSRDECLHTLAEYPGILDVFLPDGTRVPPEMWVMARALRGEAAIADEYTLRRKDTGEEWIGSYTYGPIRDGDGAITGSVMVARDVTDRRQAEDALRRSEDHVTLAQEAAHIGTTVWDRRTGTLWWSAEQRRIFGIDTETEIAFEQFMSLVHPDDRSYVLDAIGEGFSTEQTRGMNYRIVRPDGKVRFIHGEGRVFYDGDTPSYLIGTVQDVTERKEAEEALREYAENLARSNEDRERFACVASHDLQEPLRSIVSFTQLLDRRYRGKLDAAADEYIDFIVEGGTRMQGLIRDLLAFSRVNTTRQQIALTDAEDVLAEAERNLDAQLREAEATLTHDPLPVVMADPLQLAQVFSNLVSNAIKFRKPDVPLLIHVGARQLDGFREFSVRDNGIGIEPEYFDRIFVIFQRLHTKDAYPGTGIGLAIVKRIIDRHGGTIRVASAPGEGSTFFFTRPAA